MDAPERILLKLTGSILIDQTTGKLTDQHIQHVVSQIKQLSTTCQFGIVVGGGSFFRGNTQGKTLGLTPWSAHSVGMLATVMNGLILKDLMDQAGIAATLLSAVDCPHVINPITHQALARALECKDCIVFAGGTGLPYFTTDTNAVIRALQMKAHELWKGTNVDGVYDDNPVKNPHAKIVDKISFKQAIAKHLDIMDMTAFAMAQDHHLNIRVLNIFKENALIKASQNKHFGSCIQT